MSELFNFDEDAAGVLEALTGVSTASRRSCFRSIRDEKPWTLVLPPRDHDRARQLLRSFHPVRLTRFRWIQIAAPWRVDLLIEHRLTNLLQSVRVVRDDVEDTTTELAEICAKLPLLPRITKFSMADTAITDVSALVLMTELQDLNLSRTPVVDVSSLSTLTQLQSLVLKDTMLTDLSFIQSLFQLQILRVSRSDENYGSVNIPALRYLPNLHTLELEHCMIESMYDLTAAVSSVKKIRLRSLGSRAHVPEYRTDHDLELIRQFARVETVNVASALVGFLGKPLKDLRLKINEISSVKKLDADDFRVLLLDIEQTSGDPEYWSRERREALEERVKHNGNALGEVLVQLTQLKSLHFAGYNEPETLAKLSHLEELHLGCCKRELTTFNWMNFLATFDRSRSRPSEETDDMDEMVKALTRQDTVVEKKSREFRSHFTILVDDWCQ